MKKKIFKNLWKIKDIKSFKTLHDIEVSLERKVYLLSGF